MTVSNLRLGASFVSPNDTHFLLFLPTREGLTDAEKVAESFYAAACKVPQGAKYASLDSVCVKTGSSQDRACVSCKDCKPLVDQFIQEIPRTDFSFGELAAEAEMVRNILA